jgi:nucleotide-binding universal stress UspA family protein
MESTERHRIVVGVDGSPASRRALRWALDQAALTGGVVNAVLAWQLPPTDAWFTLADLAERLAEQAEGTLAGAVAAEVGDRPVTVETLVVEEHPVAALLRAAKGADLLVVGSRGHGAFTGALLGSVSHYCTQHADCPVVVVRGES